jgi:hypothetical protein
LYKVPIVSKSWMSPIKMKHKRSLAAIPEFLDERLLEDARFFFGRHCLGRINTRSSHQSAIG